MDDSNRRYKGEPLFEGWQIDEMIGKGSFGTVYRVSKEVLGTRYESAVKIIRVPTEEQYSQAKNSLHLDAPSLNRYFYDMANTITEEVNILHSLSGKSNILTYHDSKVIEHEDHAGWDILIRMEYSTPLNKYLGKGRFSREQAVRLGMDIASALSVCKGHGILHRDIKEENIFIDKDGTYKLGDFGVARDLGGGSGAGSMRGTPLYMAPEMFRGEKYDAKIDIYSLGLVLYKLTNYLRMPFWPEYPETITVRDLDKAQDKRLVGETLPPPGYAGTAFGAVILKACAFKPQDRYGSAEEMRLALEDVLKSLSTQEREENLIPQAASEPTLVDENEDDIRKRQGGTESIWSNTNSGGDPGKQPIAQEPPPTEDVRSVPKPEQPAPSDKSKVLAPVPEKRPGEGTVSLWSAPGSDPIKELKKPSYPPVLRWPKDTEETNGGYSGTGENEKNHWKVLALIAVMLLLVLIGPIIAKWIKNKGPLTSITLTPPLISKLTTEPIQEPTTTAPQAIDSKNLKYIVEDKHIVITGLSSSDTAIVIPGVIEGFPVKKVAAEAFRFRDIVSISLPEGLEYIGNDAFRGCEELLYVALPNSLVEMENNPFSSSDKLTYFDLSSENLTYEQINGVLFHKKNRALICYPAGKQETHYDVPIGTQTIGPLAFNGCNNLTSVSMSDGLVSIQAGAFANCEKVSHVTFPNSLTAIEHEAFYSNLSLDSIIFPQGLKTIGYKAFENCKKLITVKIPDSLAEMGVNPFNGCSNLTGFIVSGSNLLFEQFEGVLFNKKDKVLISYPLGKQQSSYSVPNGTLVIQNIAFEGCSNLVAVSFPQELRTIGHSAFARCKNLSKVTFTNGLESIGTRAFFNCQLSSLSLPQSLVHLGDNPFEACEFLTSIKVSTLNTVFEQKDGVLFKKIVKELVAYPTGKEQTAYSVPRGTLSIGNLAFSNCNLISVTLPEGLEFIKESAFTFCDRLVEVTLPSSVTSIVKGVFFRFDYNTNITLNVLKGTYAETWAMENNMRYVYR